MNALRILTAATGWIVFTTPCLLAAAALTVATVRFGPWPALVQAGPSLSWTAVPLILWVGWLTHHPHTWYARLAWCGVLAAAAAAYLPTPLWFWANLAVVPTGLALATVAAQEIRRWVHHRRTPTTLTERPAP